MARYNTYSEQQIDFLKTNSFGRTRKELTMLFNKRFSTNKSIQNIKAFCNNRGFNCGNNGQYKNKHKPWHSGLSGDEYKKHYTKESFERSHVGITNHRKYKIGDTVIRHGIPHVITSTEKKTPIDKRVMSKRRYVYTQYHDKIEKGHKILVLDGDAKNVSLDNLYCVPDKYIPILNKNHWLTDNPEHTLAALKWCELLYALKEVGV